MSTKIDALVADAHRAVATLKATKASAKEASLAAFVASAQATYAVVQASPRGGASRLAAVNKEAGVGYSSNAAVGYHALTGRILSMPEGEIDPERPFPSPTGIQTLVKKIGQEETKAILKGKRDQASVVYALQAAKPQATLADHLTKARKALEEAASLRVNGAEYDTDAQNEIAVILAALDLVVAPDRVVVTTDDAADAVASLQEVSA